MILDIIAAAIILISFTISMRKGLVKSVWKMTALIATIVLVIALKTPTVNYLAGTPIADNLYNSVSESLHIEIENPDKGEENEEEETHAIPDYIMKEMMKSVNSDELYNNLNGTVNKSTNELARRLTMLMLKIIAVIGLFIIIRLLLWFAFVILNSIAKLPLISQTNGILGGVLGIINALAIICILLAIVSVVPEEHEIHSMIEQSYLVKYLYNYNILLQLIMKI